MAENIKKFDTLISMHQRVIQEDNYINFPDTQDTAATRQEVYDLINKYKDQAIEDPEQVNNLLDAIENNYMSACVASEERGFIIGFSYAMEIFKEL